MDENILCTLLEQRIPPEQFQLWGLDIHWMSEEYNTVENRAIVDDVIANYDTLAATYLQLQANRIVDNSNDAAITSIEAELLNNKIKDLEKRIKIMEGM